jgi:hypothetical protein
MTEGTEADVDRLARRRRRRHAAVLIVVVVALVAALLYVLAYNRRLDQQPTAAPSPTCTTSAAPPTVPAKLIHLRVVNATNTAGLADQVAGRLEKRRFHVIGVANYHGRDPVTGVAEVHYGPIGRNVARAVAGEVHGQVKLVKDERVDPSVDLVLGPKWHRLVKLPPEKPGSFTLNVYNTTDHPGWAGDVAKQLKKRGFKIGEVGNYAAIPKAPVEIHFGTDGDPAARRVALQFKGAELVKDDRSGSSVDLLIGNDYTVMVPEDKATPTAGPTTPSAASSQECAPATSTPSSGPAGTPSPTPTADQE